MNRYNISYRLYAYYKNNGILKTFLRICEHPYRLTRNQVILYYADMLELSDIVLEIPHNITIEPKRSYDEAVRPNMKIMVNYWNENYLMDRVRERFKKGSILWIIKIDDDISGFVWSIKGKMVSPYYFPLTPQDAVLFDSVIFEEFRGHGLYPLLMNYVFWQLKADGVRRTFGHSHAWNKASIHGIEKTYFHRFGQARKYSIFNRIVVIYSDVRAK